jgi:hypothetical protein
MGCKDGSTSGFPLSAYYLLLVKVIVTNIAINRMDKLRGIRLKRKV